ncbi:MAG: dTDP-4-dehydrorhamnose 3,5-epimerase [Oligoflexia bacterium]|nr:dTDP-4-dehydrorhamnose 3,5-epimerase [Oligoflexia bacterium]
MLVHKTPIEGLLILEPRVFKDDRGYFFEGYNARVLSELVGLAMNFVQDNQSLSSYGTLRGLHFQTGESIQAKLVRVLCGRVWDVAVDLRPGSKTYKQHFGLELSDENKLQFFIPRGFAHGFVVLSDKAEFFYKVDNYYSKAHDAGIFYDDVELGIKWPIPREHVILSEKDRALPNFSSCAKELF